MKKYSLYIGSLALIVLVILIGSRLAARLNAGRTPYPMLKVFSEVLHLVQQKYVEVPDIDRLHDGALAGLTKAYGHNASLMSSDEVAFWSQGPWEIIQPGLLLYDRGNYFFVTGVIPGSPAAEAGIRRGDRIYEIEREAAIRMNLVQAYRHLAGAPDTTVRVGIFHIKNQTAEYVDLKRVNLLPLRIQMALREAEHTGVLRIHGLGTNGDQLIADTLRLWKMKGLERLVLDVRNCLDWNYETAFRVVDLFRDRGHSGRFEGRNGEVAPGFTFKSVTTLFRGPMVIVTDLSTAGACEVMAGLLKPLPTVTVIGKTTPGEVRMYHTVRVNDNLFLWIPVARLIQKDGTVFASEGLKPDVMFPKKSEKIRESPFIEDDRVIDEALKLLRKSHKKVA